MSSFLIVDDSKMMNNGLATRLAEESHSVTQVFTLADAISAVREKEFDYILLDLILPDGDGEMLLPFVQNKRSKVIVLTTDRDSFRRDKIFNFGIVDYIIKDRVFSEIAASIEELYKKIESNNEYTILVVDDSNFIRKNITQMLEKRGINVVQANNGKEALSALLSRRQIDMAIVDLEMPEMDGFTLVGKMKKSIMMMNIPVMILTGSNDANIVAKVIKSGVWDFSKKPYVVEELLLKVDNILERLKQSREIEKHRLHFGMYYDAMKHSTLFLRLNNKLEIEYMNKPLKNLLNVDDAPRSLSDIMHGDNEATLKELKSSMSDGVTFQVNFGVRNGDEMRGYVSATFSAITSAESELEEILMIAQDTTVLQAGQDLLNQKINEQISINMEQKSLMFQQAKMASMGEMIGNIAHQWRQPLSAISLFVQDFEDAYEFGEIDEAYVRKMVEKAMSQINFMSKTIDDFRNFFQPNKLKQEFDVLEAIDKTLEIVSPIFKSYAIHCEIRNESKSKVLFYGYQNEFQQVILNLLNNAKDAILEKDKDGVLDKRLIVIDILQDDEKIELCVCDNGGGIPSNILERIFEPYFSTKDEGKGTGVGLYMSKMIIEQNMNGSLGTKNGSDGAIFTIAFSKADTLR